MHDTDSQMRQLDEQYARDPARHGTAEKPGLCECSQDPINGSYEQPELALYGSGLPPESSNEEVIEEQLSPGIHERVHRAQERVG